GLPTSIHQLIVRTQATFGFTGVVVSHTIPQVFEISDYVAILAGGVIEEIKPTKEFKESKNPVVQQFIRGEIEGPIRGLYERFFANQTRTELTVGVFVLVGIVCLGYLAIRLGKLELLGNNGYVVYAHFASVA